MHKFNLVAGAFVAFALTASPALAVDNSGTVSFNGILLDSCIVIPSAGVLAVSADGLSMGTEETGGAPAALSVTAIGTLPQVSFTAPALTSSPAGYTGSPTQSIKFSATGASGQASYTSNASTSQLTALTAAYVINGKVSDSSGLHGGAYTMTTVATCTVP